MEAQLLAVLVVEADEQWQQWALLFKKELTGAIKEKEKEEERLFENGGGGKERRREDGNGKLWIWKWEWEFEDRKESGGPK